MAFDAFWKLGDGSKVPGEAHDARHAGEIDILGFTVEASNPTTLGTSVTGGGGGRAQISAFTVTKRKDRASPVLLQMCCQGERFDTATVTVRKAGGRASLEYLIYQFTDVYLTQIRTEGRVDGPHDIPLETVAFTFSSIHERYVPQKADGTGDAAIEGGWDLARNRPA